MKRYFLLVFFLSATIICSGQQLNDNIKNPATQIFMQSLVEDLNRFPLNYQYCSIKDYTVSSLYFKTEDGNYKDGRTPQTVNDFGLKTQGMYHNKKNVFFFGDISIAKSYYKNLKWNLSYQLPKNGLMEDPHYFGVSKGSSWNNQRYDLKGGFIVPISTKISLLVKSEYCLFNKYRVELDPRAKISFNNLNFNIGLSYDIGKKHHLKVSLLYGYTHIYNDIKFSNNNKNIPANYDIYVKWLSGYGSLSSLFKKSTQRRMKHYKGNLGYAFTTDILTIMADFQYERNDQITYRNNNVIEENNRDNYFAIYNTDIIGTTVLGIYEMSGSDLLKFKVRHHSEKGENYWEFKSGKSYSSLEKNLSLSFAYLKFSSSHKYWDMGISTVFRSVGQLDALATTTSDHTNLDIKNYVLHSFPVSSSLIFSPYLKSMLRFNIDNKYIQGNEQYLETLEENDFAGYTQGDYYNEVIIPNSELYSTNQLNFDLGITIQIKTKQNYSLSTKIQGGVSLPLQKLKNFTSSSPDRFVGSASLTIGY